MKDYKAYLIDCIDSEGHDIETNTPAEKIEFLFNCFETEAGWNINRKSRW